MSMFPSMVCYGHYSSTCREAAPHHDEPHLQSSQWVWASWDHTHNLFSSNTPRWIIAKEFYFCFVSSDLSVWFVSMLFDVHLCLQRSLAWGVGTWGDDFGAVHCLLFSVQERMRTFFQQQQLYLKRDLFLCHLYIYSMYKYKYKVKRHSVCECEVDVLCTGCGVKNKKTFPFTVWS